MLSTKDSTCTSSVSSGVATFWLQRWMNSWRIKGGREEGLINGLTGFHRYQRRDDIISYNFQMRKSSTKNKNKKQTNLESGWDTLGKRPTRQMVGEDARCLPSPTLATSAVRVDTGGDPRPRFAGRTLNWFGWDIRGDVLYGSLVRWKRKIKTCLGSHENRKGEAMCGPALIYSSALQKGCNLSPPKPTL